MNEIKTEKGGISVQTEHIFPVIKKWLYSEKEIFLREIVSNACDAITKLKRLMSLGEVKDIEDDFKITVTIDKGAGTLTVSDNGIGMTRDEVKKYICQIALSGALDFIEKYEGKEDKGGSGIIGHFGLGFYSSFMVSDTVDVITRSFDGSDAVKFICKGDGMYEITEAERTRGTDVIMHISDSEKDYLNEGTIRKILNKYCKFMPVEIYLEVVHEDDCTCDECKGENKKELKPVNNTQPLWMKNPSDCTDEEYKKFYDEVFSDYREPLFYIHINADYPLNFRGILYFPKIRENFDNLEGQIKLYYNQVFVADNIKELVPEFLLSMRGVVDCPELPLNVSRSYLQNSGYVSKISSHIVKKVADKLNSLCQNERENYEKLWKNIKLFVEYGAIKDRKFYDRIKKSLLFEKTDGKYFSLGEFVEGVKEKSDEEKEVKIYYATDKKAQARYISMFTAEGIDVVLLDLALDPQLISKIEYDGELFDDKKHIKFLRVDTELADKLKTDEGKKESEELVAAFKEVVPKDVSVKFESLKDKEVPAIINVSENTQRFADMMKIYGYNSETEEDILKDATLVLNAGNPLIEKLSALDKEKLADEKAKAAIRQIYLMAVMSLRQLTPSEMKELIEASSTVIDKVI